MNYFSLFIYIEMGNYQNNLFLISPLMFNFFFLQLQSIL